MRRILASLAFVLLIACNGDRRALIGAVRDYDNALIAAFRTGDLRDLQSRATQKELRRVEALVDLKRSIRVVLESEMTHFKVESAARSGASGALVRTQEVWRYRDRALDPGTAAAPTYVSRMTMEYDLERHDDAWRVSHVRTLSNEFLEPNSTGVAQRPHRSGS